MSDSNYKLFNDAKACAILELGRLEIKENNFESARYIFEELLNSNSRIYALIELGKLELLEGNKEVASSYFSKVKHENCADRRWGLIEIKKVKEDLLEIENKEYVISDKYGYLKVN